MAQIGKRVAEADSDDLKGLAATTKKYKSCAAEDASNGNSNAGKLVGASSPGIWVVADPRSTNFGQPFEDHKALAEGQKHGSACLVTTDEGILLLEQATSSEDFLASYKTQLKGSGSSELLMQPSTKPLTSSSNNYLRHLQRHAQLGHIDIFTLRPDHFRRRVFFTLASFTVYVYMVTTRYYRDKPPSIALLLLLTITYPIVLYLLAQLMHRRGRPVQRYAFESLLFLDIYQFVTSTIICLCVCYEAYALDLLFPPWGNPSHRSSLFLRKLVWLHYHNRIIELLDMIIRISQKKFSAYAALHVYLRLMILWGWLTICHVGGGDIYFHTMLDAGVTSIRFFVFTLTILRWNWNIHLDFGMHAPKMALFRKEHLYHLQIAEFALLLCHALYCGYWNTMSRWLALFQALAMCNGLSIFTDFYYSRDSAATSTRKEGKDARLTFSFDSSCWLFIYHFGVAKWIQDHVHVTKEGFAFSGSSGGALVASCLAAEQPAEKVKSFAVEGYPRCRRNPMYMFHLGEQALDHFFKDTNLHERCSGHLRVLLTKVSSSPPILTAEVASNFQSWRELFSCLRASMHVPLAAGILPYPIPGRGWYYDGLVWAALFVPWRAFDDDDVVVRVSACGFPNAQIGPRVPFPFWWLIMPPSQKALEGMFWMGYRDAGEYFAEVVEGSEVISSPINYDCCHRRRKARAASQQVQCLRKHLRPDQLESFDDNAARLVADLQTTAMRHWWLGFCVLVPLLSGLILYVIFVVGS